MDNISSGSAVELRGYLGCAPRFSHMGKSRAYYTFQLVVPRLSGTEDKLNIVCDKALLDAVEPEECDMLRVCGELRSYNNKSGVGSRLVIYVYAHDISMFRESPENSVRLRGALCKKPQLRSTPLGRDICDLLVAVNRPFGHSDYLPCICWGRNALEASTWAVGDLVALDGRIQSRDYIKLVDGQEVTRTAFEVSVAAAEKRS